MHGLVGESATLLCSGGEDRLMCECKMVLLITAIVVLPATEALLTPVYISLCVHVFVYLAKYHMSQGTDFNETCSL